MYLRLPPLSPFHSPSKKTPSPSNSKSLADLFHTFDGSLLRHLESLITAPYEAGVRPAVSFSYLSHAAGVLSSIHAVAGALISDPSLSGSDEAALLSYINSSIKLLDVCNAASAEIERLHHRRLLLQFIAHMLSAGEPPPPEKIQKARDSIREWEGSSPTRGCIRAAAAGLIRDLGPRGPPPSGKATVLGRAIYAVEVVSSLVAGALLAFLGWEWDMSTGDDKVPREFGWAEAFNELRAALSGEICRRPPGDMEAVEASVRKVAEIIDEPAGEGKKTERLRRAVKDLGTATEELTEGLGRLGGAVNELFRAASCTRNVALESFRPGAKKCK